MRSLRKSPLITPARPARRGRGRQDDSAAVGTKLHHITVLRGEGGRGGGYTITRVSSPLSLEKSPHETLLGRNHFSRLLLLLLLLVVVVQKYLAGSS